METNFISLNRGLKALYLLMNKMLTKRCSAAAELIKSLYLSIDKQSKI